MKLRSGTIKPAGVIYKTKQNKKNGVKGPQIKNLKVILKRLSADELRAYLIESGENVSHIPKNIHKNTIKSSELNSAQLNVSLNAIELHTSMDNNKTDENVPHVPTLNEEEVRQAQLANLPPFDESENETEDTQRAQTQSTSRDEHGEGENSRTHHERRHQQQIHAQQQQQRRKMGDVCKKPDALNMQNGNISENWRSFKRQFENYLVGMECHDKPDRVKIAIFLNHVGNDAVDVLDSLNLAEADRAVYATVMNAMENFCKPRKNTVYERFVFYHRNQKSGEPFDTFLMDIRQLARSCEFEATENEMLRDRIVMGIADQKIQTKLLGVDKLTYDVAVDKCRAEEATKEQAKSMSKPVSVEAVSTHTKNTQQTKGGNNNSNSNSNGQRNTGNYTNNYTNTNNQNRFGRQNNNYYRSQNQNKNNFRGNTNTTNRSNNQNNCGNCNRKHEPRRCPAYGKTCDKCSKPNHFSVVCRSQSQQKTQQRSVATVNQIDFDNDYYISSIERVLDVDESGLILNKQKSDDICIKNNSKVTRVDDVNNGNPVWKEDLKVNDHFVSFKVDSGSGVGVLPKRIHDIIAPNEQLQSSSRVLRAFGGAIVKPLGTSRLKCKFMYKGKMLTRWLEFEVVDFDTVPLLGLVGAIKFKLIDIRRVKNHKLQNENKRNHFL